MILLYNISFKACVCIHYLYSIQTEDNTDALFSAFHFSILSPKVLDKVISRSKVSFIIIFIVFTIFFLIFLIFFTLFITFVVLDSCCSDLYLLSWRMRLLLIIFEIHSSRRLFLSLHKQRQLSFIIFLLILLWIVICVCLSVCLAVSLSIVSRCLVWSLMCSLLRITRQGNPWLDLFSFFLNYYWQSDLTYARSVLSWDSSLMLKKISFILSFQATFALFYPHVT